MFRRFFRATDAPASFLLIGQSARCATRQTSRTSGRTPVRSEDCRADPEVRSTSLSVELRARCFHQLALCHTGLRREDAG